MESYLVSSHFDLITPDGKIKSLQPIAPDKMMATVFIENISPAFVGFSIDHSRVFFNVKSTLAQIGIDAIGKSYDLNAALRTAEVTVEFRAIGPLAVEMLSLLKPGAYVGKLFAKDERRRVRDPEYLYRMFGRSDHFDRPLLSLGGLQGGGSLILEKVEGRTVAYLALLDGVLHYAPYMKGFLPTLAAALHYQDLPLRALVQINQVWHPGEERRVVENDILLVKTLPLHIRTVFAQVVDELLPHGYRHTSARVLEPTTTASGDVYELFGSSDRIINDIPLEFYTLEPHREYVFFADRDQLQACLEDPVYLFKAFDTAPKPEHHRCAVFVVKGEQLINLKTSDWIARPPIMNEFPGLIHPSRQAMMVERYIQHQPSYPFLKAIEDGLITSEGILLCRYFPTPLLKSLLLSDNIKTCLKGIYFEKPSQTYGDFFSHEDRSFLHDLAKFAIPTFWVDKTSGKILQYVPKPDKDSGMFVPIPFIDTFLKSTSFGIYGSNLLAGNFEQELTKLLLGLKEMRPTMTHPFLNKDTPIALVTGGGPGVMELGNRVAKQLQILSCANIVDFRAKTGSVINEQHVNPYIDAKMTYRLDRLVERQAEFNLDFPIFLVGGMGTDFEYCLEELRRKVGSASPNPVILFGEVDYWKQKISPRFACNLKSGTIAGSEWVSNCFYCIQTAEQGLNIYRQFFSGTLPIGKNGPIYNDGFVIVP